MPDEVCYERLRPEQLRARREACPVAYIPIGTLEWHGIHNPVGLDTLKAHALSVRCAQAGGGLVFPPLYYGESREEALVEACAKDRDKVAELMGLSPDNFAQGQMRISVNEQIENYQRLLLHILAEVKTLGFKVAVFCAGHYPLIDHARAVCCTFHQQRWGNRRGEMIPWAFVGYELVRDEFEHPGDHAAFWETSLIMALVPGLADLSVLPKDENEWPVGVGGAFTPQRANAEYGEKAVQAIVRKVLVQVNDRLANPGAYYGHGLRL